MMARHPGVRGFFELLGRFKLEYFAVILVLSLLSGLEGVVHPLLIKSIFDEGVIRGSFNRFLTLAIAYVTFGLSINIVSAGTAMWGRSLENRIIRTTSRRLLEAYYDNEYQTVLREGHGYFINRVYGDVNEGLVPLLRLIQATINQTVLLVSSSVVLVYLSWRAFLILAALIPIAAVASALLGRKIRALTTREREQEGAVLSILTKALGAFRIVNSFRLATTTVNAFDHRLEEYLLTSYRKYVITSSFVALNDSTMVVSDFLSMFIGALFVLRGSLTFGAYLAFVNTFWRAVTTLMQLLNYITEFQSLTVIANRITSFLASSRTQYYTRGDSPVLNDIRFSYGGDPVLNDVSLQLDRGERVIIVGPNGSGKTTLANVLSGYLAPSKGSVTLPERISSITLPLAFPPVPVKDLVTDLDLLSAFGLGNKVVLETFADELSSGQQQKLALSLALSRNADLYVIDEPLANLDEQSRDIAMNLLLERTRGKTVVLIMHGSQEYHKLFDRVVDIEDPREIIQLSGESPRKFS